MKRFQRREFLKRSVAAGASLAALPALAGRAAPVNILSSQRMGVLVDTTACIGCRNCEWACRDAHGLPTPPLAAYEDERAFAAHRRPDETALTVVNREPDADEPGRTHPVKVQCMHCAHPACVSACIVGALAKDADGAVVWNDSRCIGCRYCMVACPFQIPAFEFGNARRPSIRKCDFCAARQARGEVPACVDICPVGALTYGPREDLVNVARNRVRRHPDRYHPHIYGEYEVGGTDWLYLAAVGFDRLGFPKLGERPAPGVSESIQHGIFAYFVPPVSLYALLGVIMWVAKHRPRAEEDA